MLHPPLSTTWCDATQLRVGDVQPRIHEAWAGTGGFRGVCGDPEAPGHGRLAEEGGLRPLPDGRQQRHEVSPMQ